MKKVQPAVETIVCDVCGCERAYFICGSRVTIDATRRTGLMGDVQGCPKKQLDLCDECSNKLDSLLKLSW